MHLLPVLVAAVVVLLLPLPFDGAGTSLCSSVLQLATDPLALAPLLTTLPLPPPVPLDPVASSDSGLR